MYNPEFIKGVYDTGFIQRFHLLVEEKNNEWFFRKKKEKTRRI
jgi:acetyl-CoA carboxylase biotin carboxylase subunit